MDEINWEANIEDYIDIEHLGLDPDDLNDDADLPPIDIALIRNHTAIEDHSEIILPTPLSTDPSGGFSAQHFEYVAKIPEYPNSHKDGVAYVIDLKGVKADSIQDYIHDHQYGQRRKYSTEIYCPFLGCKVKKRAMICTGVKACEYLNPDISNLSYYNADEILWTDYQELRSNVSQNQDSLTRSKRKTLSTWLAYQDLFKTKRPCEYHLDSCKPILRYHTQEQISRSRIPYICCTHYHSARLTPGHYYSNLSGKILSLDLQLLSELSEGTNPIAIQRDICDTVYQNSAKQRYCSISHPQGIGNIENITCGVWFYSLIPLDIQSYPYAIFISKGMHTHPPPPPNRLPHAILKDLLSFIHRLQRPDLTLTGLLQSPALLEFCQKYNKQTLAQVHTSLANLDRVGALLIKERALNYPKGRQLNGVIWEHEQKPAFRDYTRKIFCDRIAGPMVICGFDAQIQVLASLDHFEVDMSYKRVKGDMNEVIFAVFLEKHKKIFTLLRVFMSRETEDAFKLMFERVFSLIEDVTGSPIGFHYLDQYGIKAVISDMDKGQMKGLGLYLRDRDPDQRSWEWHCENIMIFCQVHFKRTISQMIPHHEGAPYPNDRKLLEALPHCKSQPDYNALLRKIGGIQNGRFKDWVRHKKHPVIAAGLCGACSRMDPAIRLKITNSTNSAEQSHYKSYWTGVYVTLLIAIHASAIRDQQDIDEYAITSEFGMNHVSRDRGQTKRMLTGSVCENSRKRARAIGMENVQFYVPNNLNNDDEDILSQASSSGFVRSRSSSRGRGSPTAYHTESQRGRSHGRSQARSSSRSLQSSPPLSQSLRRRASSNLWGERQSIDNLISLENEATRQRREELRIRREELELRMLEAQARKAELENEALERQLAND